MPADGTGRAGRLRPPPARARCAGSEFTLDTDLVIVAIGAGANPLLTKTTPGLALNRWGYIVADERGRTGKARRLGRRRHRHRLGHGDRGDGRRPHRRPRHPRVPHRREDPGVEDRGSLISVMYSSLCTPHAPREVGGDFGSPRCATGFASAWGFVDVLPCRGQKRRMTYRLPMTYGLSDEAVTEKFWEKHWRSQWHSSTFPRCHFPEPSRGA